MTVDVYEPGDLVLAVTHDGDRVPARVVRGPHRSGEFVVVVLCDPKHWPDGPEGSDPLGYWDEWRYEWPVDAIEPSA